MLPGDEDRMANGHVSGLWPPLLCRAPAAGVVNPSSGLTEKAF